MRIILATGILYPEIGGPATYVPALAKELKALGHDVEVVTYSDETSHVDDANVGYPVHRVVRTATLTNYWQYIKILLRIAKGANVIYSFDHISAGVPAAIVSWLRGTPLVVRVGGDFLWERYLTGSGDIISLKTFYQRELQKNDGLRLFLMRQVFGVAARVIFTTKFQADIFRGPYGIHPMQISYVQNPAPSIPHDIVHTGTSEEILLVGRLVNKNNFARTIRAFHSASMQHLRLVVIGDGPEKSSLESLTKELGVDARFEPAIPRTALWQRLSKAKAVIFPSVTDISPNTMLDAIAVGVPFITSREIGYDWVLECVPHFDPTDEGDIARALEDLEDEEKYRPLKETITSLKIDWSFADVAKKTVELFTLKPAELMISLDKEIANPESAVSARMREYGKDYPRQILIPANERMQVTLSADVHAVTTGGTKPMQLLKLFTLGKKIRQQCNITRVSTQDPFFTGLAGLYHAHAVGAPLEVQLHGDYYGGTYYRAGSLKNRVHYWLGRLVLPKAENIRVVSKRIKKSLLALGIAAEKITVRPITITNREGSDTLIQSIKETYTSGRLYIAVGRLEPVKNMLWLIETFAVHHKEFPEDKLVIIGSGSQQKELENLIKQHALGAYVELIGFVDDVVSYMKAADALLFPSLSEGYGLVAMEAHAAGCKVIMTDVGVAGYELPASENVRIVPINGQTQFLYEMKRV